MKIDQPGNKPDYDLKQHQQQPVRSSPDSQNIRNVSSVLQNSHSESNAPKASGLPQPKPAVAKRSPTEEQKQNGTNGKAHHVSSNFKRSEWESNFKLKLKFHNNWDGLINKMCELQDEAQARATSRASSHKSQEDIARSSSRSRLKLLEKPVEPPKKGLLKRIFWRNFD